MLPESKIIDKQNCIPPLNLPGHDINQVQGFTLLHGAAAGRQAGAGDQEYSCIVSDRAERLGQCYLGVSCPPLLCVLSRR